MINELKINFYRLIRTTSFRVILVLFVLSSICSAVEVKAFVDDPGGIMSYIFAVGSVEEKDSEIEKSEPEVGGVDIDVSLSKLSNTLRNTNTIQGVLKIQYYDSAVFLFNAIMTALFVGAEFKSRFHVNRFSVNTSPVTIVMGEWVSLLIVSLILEIIGYGIALGLSYLLCNSFSSGSPIDLLSDFCFVSGISCVYITLAYAIAYIRRTSAMSIVCCALLSSGILDIVFLFAAKWVKPLQYFAFSSTMNKLLYDSMTSNDMIGIYVAMFVVTAISLGSTLAVASKRDAY